LSRYVEARGWTAVGPLAYRNAIAVRPDPDFRRDIERLIDGIVGHATKSATA